MNQTLKTMVAHTCRAKHTMAVMPPAKNSALTREQVRYQTCVHEAAHAVLGYCFGAPLNDEGCYISSDDEGYTGHRPPRKGWDANEHGVMTHGGTIAEWRWLGKPTRLTGWNIGYWYTFVRTYVHQEGTQETDATTMLRLALQVAPRKPYGTMGAWNWQVQRLFREAVVWDSIISTANGLYYRTRLEAKDVERIIRNVVRAAKGAGFKVPTKYTEKLYALCGTGARANSDGIQTCQRARVTRRPI